MRKLTGILALLLSTSAVAGTAFYRGEAATGTAKLCYYDFMGTTYTLTVSVAALCPVSIKV